MDNAEKRRWRDFICSSKSGARYLSSIGSAVLWSEQLPVDNTVLSDFLARLRGGINDVRLLASALDLLRPDYLQFLITDATRLLDHLSNEMIRIDEVVGPALRGNPRWDRTMLGRMAGQLPAGKYFSRTAHRSFERPENLLLKWLLNDLLRSTHFLARKLGQEQLHPSLRHLLTKCEEVARHHWLSDVPTPTRLEYGMLTSGRHHKQSEYRRAAELAARRSELELEVSHGRWKSILSLLSAGWLEPLDPNDLFELYALAICLDVISVELGFGNPKESSLVVRDREHIASFEKDSMRIQVYFDQSPKTFLGVEDRFSHIAKIYRGMSGIAHRPDITIVKRTLMGEQRTVFVEVKNSRSTAYLADSVYKAFAYLHDFGDSWTAGQSNPRIVLFVPGDAEALADAPIPEVAFASGEDRVYLSSLLNSAFFGEPVSECLSLPG